MSQSITITNNDGKHVVLMIQSDDPARLADVVVHTFTGLDAVKIGAMLSCAGADLVARQALPGVVDSTAKDAAVRAGAPETRQ